MTYPASVVEPSHHVISRAYEASSGIYAHFVRKAPIITPASTLASRPVDSFNKLPTELLLLIARFCLQSPKNGYFRVLFRLTQVNSRLRNILVGTPSLWVSFVISDADKSFNLAQLCIERSKSLPLQIQVSTYMLRQQEDLGDRFREVLHPIAPRIRVLTTYMTTYSELNIVRQVLEKLNMPLLEEINLDYDSMFHDGPDRTIRIPGVGANLRTLTTTGLFPASSNIKNLKSLTIRSAAFWRWSTTFICALVTESQALENLTFSGGESTFEVVDRLVPFALSCPSLRSLTMEGGIAANFTTRFLLALHAPNLESVRVTTPSLLSYEKSLGIPVYWDQVINQIEARGAKGTAVFENVQSLAIDPDDDGLSPRHNRGFFRFLMAAFPRITSLDLDRTELGVLNICNKENDLLEGAWRFLNKLIIRGNPSHHSLERMLGFVRVRNGTGHVGLEGVGADGSSEKDFDEEGSSEDDYDESEGDETKEDEDEVSGNKVDDSATEMDEDANKQDIDESSGAAEGGSDANSAEGYLMPIETVVIKGRKTADAFEDELIRRFRAEVRNLSIVSNSNSTA
ncbi:hypothetical protein FRC00_006554 [Tulasnella sp. 408]|nr:hypothetical protein FRC00_006554 [Tulasnella sp. 408]